ncbi:putative glycosyl transferase, family 14, beta-glucuronosyltransferase GlcAT14A/B/C [Helianthus annuus]|nr:putative glycosyl transferase, family 14, beta-glucuronosyltransferase GlcAT14A/B/C [Helianthus annuus]KAJ0618009.1 putative glycosyl transferase, family 14, beta-glucuronosyltransferase GlcAT14A/B/C [Helianthus annuus]KAJ0950900.1 putative glycosyl transferase, family 14 [Helianthus annuus]
MITKANLVTYHGPTMVANKLHAAAMLLRDGEDWDWFINLSASDYPLPVIVDPGLYMSDKSDVLWITQRRSVPTAFKLFTGFCYGILFLYRELFRLYLLVIIGLPLNIVIWTYR